MWSHYPSLNSLLSNSFLCFFFSRNNWNSIPFFSFSAVLSITIFFLPPSKKKTYLLLVYLLEEDSLQLIGFGPFSLPFCQLGGIHDGVLATQKAGTIKEEKSTQWHTLNQQRNNETWISVYSRRSGDAVLGGERVVTADTGTVAQGPVWWIDVVSPQTREMLISVIAAN